MNVHFFAALEPPDREMQKQRLSIYQGSRIKRGQDPLVDQLIEYVPNRPLTGPLRMHTMWLLPAKGTRRHGQWCMQDPDLLDEMLQTIMKRLGFMVGLDQVVWRGTKRVWTRDRAGVYVDLAQLDNHSGLVHQGKDKPQF